MHCESINIYIYNLCIIHCTLLNGVLSYLENYK